MICKIFGHKYVVERVLNEGARKLGCTRCNRKWAMHDATKSLVDWDGEFEEMYSPNGILSEPTKKDGLMRELYWIIEAGEFADWLNGQEMPFVAMKEFQALEKAYWECKK